MSKEVLEAAILQVQPEKAASFEQDFETASQYISAIEGYLGHSLNRCLEAEGKYLLLVRWQNLEAHTEGFRKSAEYLEWKQILHHYYDPFPTVEHFEEVYSQDQ